jgi:hypothetical protein
MGENHNYALSVWVVCADNGERVIGSSTVKFFFSVHSWKQIACFHLSTQFIGRAHLNAVLVHSSVFVAYSKSRHISWDPVGCAMGFFNVIETDGCIWLHISRIKNY